MSVFIGTNGVTTRSRAAQPPPVFVPPPYTGKAFAGTVKILSIDKQLSSYTNDLGRSDSCQTSEHNTKWGHYDTPSYATVRDIAGKTFGIVNFTRSPGHWENYLLTEQLELRGDGNKHNLVLKIENKTTCEIDQFEVTAVITLNHSYNN